MASHLNASNEPVHVAAIDVQDDAQPANAQPFGAAQYAFFGAGNDDELGGLEVRHAGRM